MSMIKRLRFLSILAAEIFFLSCLPALSYAERTIVKPIPVSFDPNCPRQVSVYGRITDYNDKDCSITVEFIVPEFYAREDIINLKPGDIIVSQGREVEVKSIDFSDFDVNINAIPEVNVPDEDIIWMHINTAGYYHRLKEERIVTTVLDPVRISLYDLSIFLDAFDYDSASFLPSRYSAEEFNAKLTVNGKGADTVFTSSLFWFNFDDYGQLVCIWRIEHTDYDTDFTEAD